MAGSETPQRAIGQPAAGKARGVLNNVQVLRGLAAMMVVLFHAGGQSVDINIASRQHFAFGTSGVDIFFAISGFIMVVTSHSLWGLPGQWWDGFLKRRLSRIVPLYWFFTTLKLMILAALPWLALHSPIQAWYVSASYLFVPALNPLSQQIEPLLPVGWTLNFEMLFYVVFAIGMAISAKPLRVVFPVLILFAIVGLARSESWGPAATLLDPILLEFLLGACVGLAFLRGARLPAWLAVSMGVLALAALPSLAALLNGHAGNTVNLWRLAYFGIPGALLLMSAISLEHAGWNAGPRSLAVLLGNASYAIYLSHGFIIPAIARICMKVKLGQPTTYVLLIVLSCVVSAVVGIVVHKYVEQPLLLLFRDKKARATKALAGGLAS